MNFFLGLYTFDYVTNFLYRGYYTNRLFSSNTLRSFCTTEDPKSEKASGSTKFEEKFGKNKQYVKPDFLKDDYDHLGNERDISEEDFLPDYFSKDSQEYKRNPITINLPWLINGAPNMEMKTRYMGDQIFSRIRVHKGEVLEHLYKVYRAVLLSAADRDYDFLREYCEETFANKFIKRLEQLREKGYTFTVTEDFEGSQGSKSKIIAKPIEVEANMYDHTVIKGVTMNRKENGSEIDYIIHNDIENMGFISYVPKYITMPENFTDKNKNKYIHEDAHHIVFRAYVCIKSGYKIQLTDSTGKELIEYGFKRINFEYLGIQKTTLGNMFQYLSLK